MNVIPLRTSLSFALLLMMVRQAAALEAPVAPYCTAFDPPQTICCDMRPYNLRAVLDEVKLENATLEEAVAQIKAAAIRAEPAANNGLNIVILGTASEPKTKARINLDLKGVPLEVVLQEVARTFGMKTRLEPVAVVLAPLTSPDPIHTRIYRVPPHFLQAASASK